jgi:hypothetical protein
VTGRKVAATAAPMFKKLSLELGGKNATIGASPRSAFLSPFRQLLFPRAVAHAVAV